MINGGYITGGYWQNNGHYWVCELSMNVMELWTFVMAVFRFSNVHLLYMTMNFTNGHYWVCLKWSYKRKQQQMEGMAFKLSSLYIYTLIVLKHSYISIYICHMWIILLICANHVSASNDGIFYDILFFWQDSWYDSETWWWDMIWIV